MVPFLLLLLLPASLAEDVCVNISDRTISANFSTTYTIFENHSGEVKCSDGLFSCFIQCTNSKRSPWFNGSSDCSAATVEHYVDSDMEEYDLTYGTCKVFPCQNNSILQLINFLNSPNSYEMKMMQLFDIKASCPTLFRTDYEVKEAFIQAEKQMIHNIMGATQLDPGDSVTYDLTALFMTVFNISDTDLATTGSSIQITAPQLPSENPALVPEIWFPVYALQDIPKEERVISLISYMEQSQFQFDQEEISSMVLRIELLGDRRLQNLTPPIEMSFKKLPHIDVDNTSRLQCHYFDEHDLLWKTDGCETSGSQTDIICKCNHTTPFAVLLMREPISEIHWKVLSYITYIGCGLSAFFSALSLLIYVFGRNHKMDYSISIHVSLSGALFLLNTTFLLTEWGATVKQDWVCVFVAAFMHYSLLCSFTWMAIEALHLYLLLIKVFNTYFKHYLIKLSLAGWGIPGVIVAVSLGMKDFKQFYGVTEMTMADTNQTSAICWITDDSFFYSLNLSYFTLIFIFNSGILLAVASKICRMKQVFRSNSKPGAEADGKISERSSESCRSSLTVMGLTCLMGTTWGLAFLGSGYVNYPILYLFCILNSTQGFFIFLWICLSAKKQRKREMEERLTSSTPVKTSVTKME